MPSLHTSPLQQDCQLHSQTHRKIRRLSLSSGMVVRLSYGREESEPVPVPVLGPDPRP